MRIVIAPDSFKSACSAVGVAHALARGCRLAYPDAQIIELPLADGGEGTKDALIEATKGRAVSIAVRDAYLYPLDTEFGILGDGNTAILELASVCGLPLLAETERNPLETSTFGFGLMLREVLRQGYRNILVGLGGSSTNDGGVGFLMALGASFLDEHGESIDPRGKSLLKIAAVDFSELDPRIKDANITVLSDVDNPLLGMRGATRVYGPQKGASRTAIDQLEAGMEKFSSLLEATLQGGWSHTAGAGAAGGMGFALLALGAHLTSGASYIANVVDLRERIKTADVVLTGEGQSDAQTAYGKLPGLVGLIAAEYCKPAFLLSGSLGDGYVELYDRFAGIRAIQQKPSSLAECLAHTERYLEAAAFDVIHSFKANRVKA
ncbi:glycerate kinase [Ferroacidibacillus organovorans]|uniref:Glycerate kinase n=1 Tax=Ferroacidibacillus organovorans TaxID=1765683 RepID=A0A853K8P9_9BACL|nr:glycerate kinase [Ferroacidibacillus organovorans]KYP80347.1 hypothetical protein AYJ22_11520 [Ferroacidibacillus organovorans]OAG93345.1 hypothetical protein AYW79_11140 [Ferroacidibacillus organovorans]